MEDIISCKWRVEDLVTEVSGNSNTSNFPQLLTGNRDRNTIVRHRFTRPLRARYLRVVPYTWHRHISMRVEIYGRRLGKEYFV